MTGEYVLVPAVTRSMLSSRDLLAANMEVNKKKQGVTVSAHGLKPKRDDKRGAPKEETCRL